MTEEKLMYKLIGGLAILAAATNVAAETVPIFGTVESKCVITTDTQGVYGNPTPSVLSTAAAAGGVQPIIRYDVISADYYKAVITTPDSFSTSPTLNDVVNWEGSVSVGEVTDPLMSDYDTVKIEYNNTTEYQLTVSGSTWFEIESIAEYGYDKSFPAGDYTAVVVAECIAI